MKLGDVILHGTVLENDRDDYFFILSVNKFDVEINGSLHSKDLDKPATVKVSHDFHHLKCYDCDDKNPNDNCELIFCGDSVSVTYSGHDVIKVENHTPHTDYLSLVEKYYK